MEIPFPTRTVVIPTAVDSAAALAVARRRREAALAVIDFVRPLPDDARDLLVDRAALRTYGPGEVIVRTGDASMELFVIESGSVAVEVDRAGVPTPVAELGPGHSFGEMGLLTGEPRSATVRARAVCHLVVVDHDAFHDVLASHPEVVDRMGMLLALRQAELDAASAARDQAAPPEERSRRLISQIREFFKLV